MSIILPNEEIELMTPYEIGVRLGEQIKRIRIAKNITQEELAKICGVTRKSIYNLEAGKAATTELLYKILIRLEQTDKIIKCLDVIDVANQKILSSDEVEEFYENLDNQKAKKKVKKI